MIQGRHAIGRNVQGCANLLSTILQSSRSIIGEREDAVRMIVKRD
jgi:hypothetical protein